MHRNNRTMGTLLAQKLIRANGMTADAKNRTQKQADVFDTIASVRLVSQLKRQKSSGNTVIRPVFWHICDEINNQSRNYRTRREIKKYDCEKETFGQ